MQYKTASSICAKERCVTSIILQDRSQSAQVCFHSTNRSQYMKIKFINLTLCNVNTEQLVEMRKILKTKTIDYDSIKNIENRDNHFIL